MFKLFKRKKTLTINIKVTGAEAIKDLCNQFKETIEELLEQNEAIQLELVETRQQNDRLQRRCEELEESRLIDYKRGMRY